MSNTLPGRTLPPEISGGSEGGSQHNEALVCDYENELVGVDSASIDPEEWRRSWEHTCLIARSAMLRTAYGCKESNFIVGSYNGSKCFISCRFKSNDHQERMRSGRSMVA